MTAIQGYLEIDFSDLSDDELEELRVSLKAKGIDFHRVDTGDSEYYHCLVQDPDVLDSVLTSLSSRSPVIQGAWDKNGIPYGKTKDEETGEVKGKAKYAFGLTKHFKHSKRVKEDGTKEQLTKFSPLHQYLGWDLTTEY